jgi:hypothetical protein
MLIWEPELDGIPAFAMLWTRAAQLISTTTTPDNENDNDNGNDNENDNGDGSIVIALPDSSRQLVQNWVEIIEWMSTLVENHNHHEESMRMRPIIKASMVESDNDVPAVHIQRLETINPDPTTLVDDDENNPTTANSNATNSNSNSNSVQLQINRTQAWVKRILVEQGICPFTKSVNKSGQGMSDIGVPVGSIAYHGSLATHAIPLMADTWTAMDQMILAGPGGKDGISSILLSAPAFDDDFDVWSGPIFAMLESGVVAASAQAALGVVCFHPRYATPDGTSWPGFGHMHSVPRLEKWYREFSAEEEEEQQQQQQQQEACPSSAKKMLTTEEIAAGGAWQRRTPHATINVLRADQLMAAEGRRQSGSMYTENIHRLVVEIGSEKLAQDLERERQLDQ